MGTMKERNNLWKYDLDTNLEFSYDCKLAFLDGTPILPLCEDRFLNGNIHIYKINSEFIYVVFEIGREPNVYDEEEFTEVAREKNEIEFYMSFVQYANEML